MTGRRCSSRARTGGIGGATNGWAVVVVVHVAVGAGGVAVRGRHFRRPRDCDASRTRTRPVLRLAGCCSVLGKLRLLPNDGHSIQIECRAAISWLLDRPSHVLLTRCNNREPGRHVRGRCLWWGAHAREMERRQLEPPIRCESQRGARRDNGVADVKMMMTIITVRRFTTGSEMLRVADWDQGTKSKERRQRASTEHPNPDPICRRPKRTRRAAAHCSDGDMQPACRGWKKSTAISGAKGWGFGAFAVASHCRSPPGGLPNLQCGANYTVPQLLTVDDIVTSTTAPPPPAEQPAALL